MVSYCHFMWDGLCPLCDESDGGQVLAALRRRCLSGLWLKRPVLTSRWKYASQNKVQLPDEYDQIASRLLLSSAHGLTRQFRDLEPFHAFRPTDLQKLVKEVSQRSGMYTVSCPGIGGRTGTKCTSRVVETGLNTEGKRVAADRVKGQLGLLADIEGLLESVDVVFYSHDVPWQFVGHEYVSQNSDEA